MVSPWPPTPQNLVEKTLAGTLAVTSKVGEGTCFTLQLPRTLPEGESRNVLAEPRENKDS